VVQDVVVWADLRPNASVPALHDGGYSGDRPHDAAFECERTPLLNMSEGESTIGPCGLRRGLSDRSKFRRDDGY
jgi:hypothetical protein